MSGVWKTGSERQLASWCVTRTVADVVAEAPHQERHRDLTDRHESLHYHPWFLRITRMRATIPVLLQVSATNVASVSANEPHQYKCDRCAGDDGPCHLPEVQEPSHSKPTVACTACRNAGHPCSWERSVPYRLYQLKAAILREYRDPTATGPAAGDHVRRINAAGKPKPALNLSRKALRQLSDVTFTALAEVEVRLQETFEEEIVEILDSLAEIYN